MAHYQEALVTSRYKVRCCISYQLLEVDKHKIILSKLRGKIYKVNIEGFGGASLRTHATDIVLDT